MSLADHRQRRHVKSTLQAEETEPRQPDAEAGEQAVEDLLHKLQQVVHHVAKSDQELRQAVDERVERAEQRACKEKTSSATIFHQNHTQHMYRRTKTKRVNNPIQRPADLHQEVADQTRERIACLATEQHLACTAQAADLGRGILDQRRDGVDVLAVGGGGGVAVRDRGGGGDGGGRFVCEVQTSLALWRIVM